MTRRPRLGSMSAVVALVVTLAVLAGCARSAPDLADDAATRLQQDVLTVTQASAVGDLAAARAALDALTSTVTSGRESGEISAERQTEIEASIAAVSADLATLEQAAAAEQASAEKKAAEQAAAEQEAAKQAAAEQEAARDHDNEARSDKNKNDDE